MNNNNCMLVEFVNEDCQLSTGFLDWLDKKDAQTIKDIIETEQVLFVNWPDVEVAEASVMKTRLKNASWTQQALKVLATGEWKEMRQSMKNLVEKGYASTSKETRKDLKRKVFSSPDIEPQQAKKPNKKLTNCSVLPSVENLIMKKSSSKDVPYPSYSDESETDKYVNVDKSSNDSSDASEEDNTSISNRIPMKRRKKIIDSSSDGSESMDEVGDTKNALKKLKQKKTEVALLEMDVSDRENQITELKLKINKLEVRLEEYMEKHKSLNSKLEDMRSQLKAVETERNMLRKDCDAIRDILNIQCDYNIADHEKENVFVENVSSEFRLQSNTKKYSKTNKLSLASTDNRFNEPVSLKKSLQIVNVHKNGHQGIVRTASSSQKLTDNNEYSEVYEDLSKVDQNANDNNENVEVNNSTKDGGSGQEGSNATDDVKITKSMTSKCRKDSIGHFVQDLMIVVFSEKTLSQHSVKGVQVGMNKAVGIPCRPALPKDKMEAIEDTAYERFGGKVPINKILLHKAVRELLNRCHQKYKNQ